MAVAAADEEEDEEGMGATTMSVAPIPGLARSFPCFLWPSRVQQRLAVVAAAEAVLRRSIKPDGLKQHCSSIVIITIVTGVAAIGQALPPLVLPRGSRRRPRL